MVSCCFLRCGHGRRHSLELHEADPARPLAVARAQPDVVGRGEADLDGRVRAEAGGVCELPVEPRAELAQAGLCVLVRDGPLGRELGVLSREKQGVQGRAVSGEKGSGSGRAGRKMDGRPSVSQTCSYGRAGRADRRLTLQSMLKTRWLSSTVTVLSRTSQAMKRPIQRLRTGTQRPRKRRNWRTW